MGAKRGRPKPVRSGRKKGTKNKMAASVTLVKSTIRTAYEAGLEEGRKLSAREPMLPKEYVEKDRLLYRIAWLNGVRDGRMRELGKSY